MGIATLTDSHPGKWNEGVEILLCDGWIRHDGAEFEEDDYFLTGVRIPGTPCKGMFYKDEGPLQVMEKDENGEVTLTMCNLGTISSQQRHRLLADGELEIISEYEGTVLWKCRLTIQ